MDRQYSFQDFRQIITRLRGQDGCPWDREQTHESLVSCMINELAEAVAAVDIYKETGDSENLCEELGDLLLLVFLQSQIAEEEGAFSIEDVIQIVSEKMIRRHPHVFTEERVDTTGEVLQKWEDIKKQEKTGKSTKIESLKQEKLLKAKADITQYLI